MERDRPKPVFFEKPSRFRDWLNLYHDKREEVWVGFRKKNSGQPSITWPEAVREALCYGWIDGIRKSIDDTSYTNRFTRRKQGSTWSRININLANDLIRQGLMQPSGLNAFQHREGKKSGRYSYEQRKTVKLDADFEARFKRNPRAWEFFQSKPPSYRTPAVWWVMDAKQEETRQRRFAKLLEDSENGRTIPPLTRRDTDKRNSNGR